MPIPLKELLELTPEYPYEYTYVSYLPDKQSALKPQWHFPQYILSLLLILGPDVIWRALAQLAGRRITPVVFSYGWVAYAMNVLVAAFGDGHLMPRPDGDVLVIGAKSGHVRTNRSWVLGRLLRDHEARQPTPPPDKKDPSYEALRASVFEVVSDDGAARRPGVPARDGVWYAGWAVMLLQLGIALVPWLRAEKPDGYPLLTTGVGNALALLHGAVPPWRAAKWPAPTASGGWTTSLTRGNGSRHVMVVLAHNHGLDLEILAGPRPQVRTPVRDRVFLGVMAVCWLGLLVAVAGLTSNSWYLLAVGFIGMVHNLVVAGAARSPGALGIHLRQVDTIADVGVSKVLRRVEAQYPMVGSSLVPIFFPGGMRVEGDEREFWHRAQQEREAQGLSKLAIKLD